MGKKVRSKGGNPHKVRTHHTSSSSPRPSSSVVPKKSDTELKVGGEEMENGEHCKHYDNTVVELKLILSKIQSGGLDTRCEDCRDDPVNTRGNKGKGKGGKKKAPSRSVSSAEANCGDLWVCLSCSHIGCGGGVDDSVPYGHARRHSKQERHPLVALLDNPTLGWCIICDVKITIEIVERIPSETKCASDDGEAQSRGDDTEYGKRTGDSGEIMVMDVVKGYAVRGLINLGNTCFFNSVMQNLFATEMLRQYFSSLRETVGPLTMSLKKLFSEVSAGLETNRSTMNPRNFFGCICSKAPQFKGYDQHDSHELLRCLLDGLSTEELNKRKLKNSSVEDKSSFPVHTTFVDDIFGGQLSSSVCCIECGHTSVVHEPFLDLSLPVPSKKVLPKKLSTASQKKKKVQPREVFKSRKTQERGSAKCLVTNQEVSESIVQQSESKDQSQSQSACSPLESGGSYSSPEFYPEKVSSLLEDNDMSWLDFIEPTLTPVDANLDIDGKEYPASEIDGGTILEPFVSKLQSIHVLPICGSMNEQPAVLNFSEEARVDPLQSQDNKQEMLTKDDRVNLQYPVAKSESSVYRNVVCLDLEESTVSSSLPTDEAPLLVGDKEVLLLPCLILNSTAKQQTEIADNTPESANNIDINNSLTEEPSSSACEPAEVEFDGLGDLFAEPDHSSDLGSGAAVVEEIDTSWLVEASSESNQEEVDNANSPVSVGRCLAFFIKPELLTDEHAWYCENCSRILHQQNMIKKKDIGGDYVHEVELDPGNERSQSLQSSDGNFATFSESKVLENGMSTSTAYSIDSKMKTNRKANMDDPNSHTASDITICKFVQTKSQKKSLSPDSFLSCKENCQEALDEDKNVLSDTSQYFSCNSHTEETKSVVNPNCPDDNSCTRDEVNEDGCEVQSFATIPKTTVIDKEDDLVNPFGNGASMTTLKMKNNGKKMFKGVNGTETSNPEILKVKRNATKRILIDKVPPVLTIHLKRFSQDARGRLNKLSGHVSFEEMLDLAPYMDPRSCGRNEKYRFQLVGVIEHSGGMRGGHYVAYVRGEKCGLKASKDGPNSSWFYTSDAHVREVSLAEVLHSEAYILFYRRI